MSIDHVYHWKHGWIPVGGDGKPSPRSADHLTARVNEGDVAGFRATGDMSNVGTLSDDQLHMEIARARHAVDTSKHNRAGLAYSDAHTQLKVFTAEQKRRDKTQIAAIKANRPVPPVKPSDNTSAPMHAAGFHADVIMAKKGAARDAHLQKLTTAQLAAVEPVLANRRPSGQQKQAHADVKTELAKRRAV